MLDKEISDLKKDERKPNKKFIFDDIFKKRQL